MPLKVLFFMRNLRGYFRVFEPALRMLGERGHLVHVVVDEPPLQSEKAWADELSQKLPGISFARSPMRTGRLWFHLGREIRLSLDHVRFLRPEFEKAHGLRTRPGKYPPRLVSFAARLRPFRKGRGLALTTRVLRVIERAIPPNATVLQFLAEQRPDVVLLSPYLGMGSVQPIYLQAAQALGIRTLISVASWDNLSSKALIRTAPDAVTVWNETQKRELVEMHEIPPARIAVTGAQGFDPWFEWKPRPREEFCRRVGLDPARPYLLYMGSALYAARINEAEFAQEWIRMLRASEDPRLREAGVLLRPHPKRNEEWRALDFASQKDVVVWPKLVAMPVDAEAKADFFDSMHHSAAVVGLNTTAMIEAAIAGRPVHTLLLDDFRNSQGGTLHFKYLMEVEGGCLRVAQSFAEHLAQLSQALAGDAGAAAQVSRFLEAFVRPRGLAAPASLAFVEAVERLAREPAPTPARVPAALRALRVALVPLAIASEVARRIKNAKLKGQPLFGNETFSRLLWDRRPPALHRPMAASEDKR